MELCVLSLNLTRTSDLESAITIQKAAEAYLNQLIPELYKSDLEVAELERQVKEFKFHKRSKMNGNSDSVVREIMTAFLRSTEEEKRSEQSSPLRKQLSDEVCDDSPTFKNHSTAAVSTVRCLH